jgi:hypothetical protein
MGFSLWWQRPSNSDHRGGASGGAGAYRLPLLAEAVAQARWRRRRVSSASTAPAATKSPPAAGKVQQAVVTPAPVAATPLGVCIEGVARATNFGPQPEPVAFTIPIAARVVKR